MPEISIKIVDKNGTVQGESPHGFNVQLVYKPAYKKGDVVCLEADTDKVFCVVQLEDTMPPALVYINGGKATFPVPVGFEKRMAYSPRSFKGKNHLLRASIADEATVNARRNLALNPYDTQGGEGMFPHASANIETRGQSVFAARNVIDGVFANAGHGFYPYQSWGINKNPEAELQLDLGLPCLVDEVRLTLRADFPHDNYWTQATVFFSDGSEETLQLEKSAEPQSFAITPRVVEWVKLGKLVQSDEPSPFPALTQLELWGKVGPESRRT